MQMSLSDKIDLIYVLIDIVRLKGVTTNNNF